MQFIQGLVEILVRYQPLHEALIQPPQGGEDFIESIYYSLIVHDLVGIFQDRCFKKSYQIVCHLVNGGFQPAVSQIAFKLLGETQEQADNFKYKLIDPFVFKKPGNRIM